MILSEQQQLDILRDKCTNAKKRIWIMSPFIGSLNEVQTIIDGKYILQSIDFRVLTDAEGGFIRPDTFSEFNTYGELRSLPSLHAKIYIIDDWCLVTSANLTGTAFLRRYEMGIATTDIADIVSTFNRWWTIAKPIDACPVNKKKGLIDYQDGTQFSKKFKATPYVAGKADRYEAKRQQYDKFAHIYETITSRHPKMVKDGFTLYQEVDYFFNYIYHDYPNTPSNGCNKTRNVSANKRDKEILSLFQSMMSSYDSKGDHWRVARSQKVRKLLAPSKILSLSNDEIKEVVGCLHSLHSYPINRTKFLNPQNNSKKDILKAWNMLLHSGRITYDSIKHVKSLLQNFGDSSIQELIGWYYPDEYPLMNRNSDSGMHYLEFDV